MADGLDSNPFLLVLFSIFCGVTVTPANIQYFWREWMYPLDPFTRLIRYVLTGLRPVVLSIFLLFASWHLYPVLFPLYPLPHVPLFPPFPLSSFLSMLPLS